MRILPALAVARAGGGKGGATFLSTFPVACRLVSTLRSGVRQSTSTSSSNSSGRAMRGRDKQEQSVKVDLQSSKAAASGPTMRASRFYRVVQERGFGFAMYLYVLGESTTLAVLYALHNDVWCTGDTFAWMRAVGAERLVDLDRWSQAGPVVCGLRLSPRLLLNYVVANGLTFPLYALQFAFCAKTLTLLRGVLSPFACAPVRRSRGKVVPKAPSAARGNETLTR